MTGLSIKASKARRAALAAADEIAELVGDLADEAV
jgi:hypothetical protein